MHVMGINMNNEQNNILCMTGGIILVALNCCNRANRMADARAKNTRCVSSVVKPIGICDGVEEAMKIRKILSFIKFRIDSL